MNLYDEDQMRREEKRSKNLKRIIISSIVISILVIMALILAINYLVNNPNRTIVKLNGRENRNLENIISVETDESGNISIYAPIKEIASYFGYEAFNGEYTMVSEDTNSCYVQNEEEVAVFNLDSNIIYKIDRKTQDSNYEYCKINKKIFKKDDLLYTDDEGLENGFNLAISYNAKKKIVDFYTLDTMVKSAESKVTQYGYKELDDSLENHKAILEDIMVVKSEDGQYGVVNYSTGQKMLDSKYDKITYIPHKKAFLIMKNNKVGIISSDGTTKISPEYDELTLIDNENELYLAKKDGLYGVVNINGNVIIYIEYSKIGIDLSGYEQNGIKSGYVLLNKLIPVQQNSKWGFFDITGHQVTDLKYEAIGSKATSNKGVNYDLLVIPNYDALVVKRDNKYTCINSNGEELISCVFKEMYMEMSSGKTEYYMIWQDPEGKERKYVIKDYLEK